MPENSLPPVKLLITVASCRDWKPLFAISYRNLFHELMTKKLGKEVNGKLTGERLIGLDLWECMGVALLPTSREMCLEQAYKVGATHWLSLDDDMYFPADIATRLLQHDKEAICANYSKKKLPPEGVCLDMNRNPLNSTNKTGIEQVSGMPLGCTIIKLDTIKDIPKPHFAIEWYKEGSSYLGEDYFFSQLLVNAGVKMYCDHDVSQDVKHIGDFLYGYPDPISTKISLAS